MKFYRSGAVLCLLLSACQFQSDSKITRLLSVDADPSPLPLASPSPPVAPSPSPSVSPSTSPTPSATPSPGPSNSPAPSTSPSAAPSPTAVIPIIVNPPPVVNLPAPTKLVDLVLTRFDGLVGPVSISNGIILQAGMVMPNQVDSLRIQVNGQDLPFYSEGLIGTYPDGSLKSVLVQFDVASLDGTKPLTGLLGFNPSGPRPSVLVVPTKRPTQSLLMAVALPSDPNYMVNARITGGPLFTQVQDEAAGQPTPVVLNSQAFAALAETIFDRMAIKYGPDACFRDTATYDWQVTHYQHWMRSGDLHFFHIANDLGDRWYRGGKALNGGSFAEWHAETQGFPIHYWITGHDDIRTVLNGFVQFWNDAGFKLQHWTTRETDYRLKSRVLTAELDCAAVNCDPGVDYRTFVIDPVTKKGYYPHYDYKVLLDSMIDSFLPVIYPDGSFAGPGAGTATIDHGQKNYGAGMMSTALIRYYQEWKADPRIITILTNQANYVWTLWDPVKQGFPYCSSPSFNPTPAEDCNMNIYADLNGFQLPLFSWLYAMTGDTSFRDRADTIMAGLRTAYGEYPNYVKQFDQGYSRFFNFIAWRSGVK